MKLYARHIEPIADTFAYCLLPNHFHFLVYIKDLVDLTGPKKPSQYFSNLFNAYAKAFNKVYDRTGALFQRPFGRIPVTSDAYFVHLVTYIHQNPQKHGLVADFRAWSYSSYQAHLSDKPTRLQRDDVLAWFNGPEGFKMAHRHQADTHLLAPLVPEDFD